ncbi:high mobility group protein [Skeletonema marinoi]|uniref:High mobility group protein n=1 Tax=Skeletonema marinoi TaxID=267567 RepID=A0AAD8YF27_9STRA|nr:high mobility group protein [Skeletonema marinoi]
MANAAPTSSARSIVPSEVVAIEPSNEMASCPDQACAPPAAVGGAKSTFTCTTVSASEIAPSVSSQEMHCLVTAVSSDDSATEVASALADNPAIQEGNVPPVVHHPSASASAAGIVSAPGKTHEMSVNNSVGISTAVSSDGATTEVASAPTTDDPAVQEETVPPVVPPSTSNDTNGTVSAPGKSHDMPVKSSTDTAIATCSEESTTVVEKTVSPDTLVTVPVSTTVGHIVHNDGEVHTTATAVTVCLSTTEVKGNMTNHVQDASTATAPVEVVADQMPLAKKRKCEKKATVPKDPDAPKKNLTAYMHYATYARAYLKPRSPNMKGSDVTVIVRRGWDAMSAQERNYWNEKAADDKERYETDLAEYKKSDLGVAWQARLDRERKQVTSDSTFDIYAGTKKADDSNSNAPKPFVSAFMHYDAYARDHIKSKYPQMEDAEVKMLCNAAGML